MGNETLEGVFSNNSWTIKYNTENTIITDNSQSKDYTIDVVKVNTTDNYKSKYQCSAVTTTTIKTLAGFTGDVIQRQTTISQTIDSATVSYKIVWTISKELENNPAELLEMQIIKDKEVKIFKSELLQVE